MVEATGLGEASDQDLVERIRRGPGSDASRAVTELFGRYRQRVYQWCRRYAREHDDALDLAQDVLLIAYRSLHTYEGRAPFGGWLFTIAHHRCLRATRQRPWQRDDGIVLEDLPDVRRDAQSMLEDEQDRDALLDLIRTHLDPLEQKAVWLRCVEEMPVDEITQVLNLQNATGARGLLQTARRKLRAVRGNPPSSAGGAQP